MKKIIAMVAAAMLSVLCLAGCAAATSASSSASAPVPAESAASGQVPGQDTSREQHLVLRVNGVAVDVSWADNAAVRELMEQAAVSDIIVEMSPYGGFEQVGSLGRSYSSADAQITTSCGDIVLYNGSNIVLFYGSNTWAYTYLGKMQLPSNDAADLLSGNAVTVTLGVG